MDMDMDMGLGESLEWVTAYSKKRCQSLFQGESSSEEGCQECREATAQVPV